MWEWICPAIRLDFDFVSTVWIQNNLNQIGNKPIHFQLNVDLLGL